MHSALRMILVCNRRPEQCEDAIAGRLSDGYGRTIRKTLATNARKVSYAKRSVSRRGSGRSYAPRSALALRFFGRLCYMAAMFSKTDLAIVFAVVIGALCVALYLTWIQPIQAIVAVVILVVAAVWLTVFT
jgi:multidrug efflux pump subunit AcrB